MQVPIEEIPQVAADYGDSAYVLAGASEGPPRIAPSGAVRHRPASG